MVDYKYCPQCKKSLETSQEYFYCTNCDIHIYQNPKPTASVLPVKNGKVLISIRAIEPYKGSYDTIGGFLQLDEHPEETAIRETKEETGLDIKILDLLPMRKERYGKDGDLYATNKGSNGIDSLLVVIEKVKSWKVNLP